MSACVRASVRIKVRGRGFQEDDDDEEEKKTFICLTGVNCTVSPRWMFAAGKSFDSVPFVFFELDQNQNQNHL